MSEVGRPCKSVVLSDPLFFMQSMLPYYVYGYNNLLLGRPCLKKVVSSASNTEITKKYDFP